MTMARGCLSEQVAVSPKLNNDELPPMVQGTRIYRRETRAWREGTWHDQGPQRAVAEPEGIQGPAPWLCHPHPEAAPELSSRAACGLVMSGPQEGTGSARTRWALGGCR